MRLTKNIFIIPILLFYACQEELKPNEFNLKVSFDGKKTEFLVLNYLDKFKQSKSDTLWPYKSRNAFTGFIDGFTFASISSNRVMSSNVDDPNRFQFFLESGDQYLTLTENKFKKAILEGSITNLQANQLNERLEMITKNNRQLIDERNQYFINYQFDKSDKVSKNKMDSLNQILSINAENVSLAKLDYIKHNPDSYLSAFQLFQFFRFNNIELEKGILLYENLSERVQESIFGELIQEEITASKMAQIGKKASNFSTLNFNGESISLDQFKGKYVLLDFWAGWCKPCKALHPELKSIYEKYHTKGLEIIGISFDRDSISWKKSIETEELNQWYHVYDGFKNIGKNNSLSQKYNITPIPAYVLIDRNGIIQGRYLGADKENKDLSKNIEDLKTELAEIFDDNLISY
jgi:thiol-disulfide isomerase/thioredoxin